MCKLRILTSAIVLAIVTAAAALAAGARVAREFARPPMSSGGNLSEGLVSDRFGADRFAPGRAFARGFDRDLATSAERSAGGASHRRHVMIPVTGYIVAMDPATHDLTVKVPRNGQLVLEVVHASQLDASGHRIRWGALKTGDQVRLDYTKYGSKLVVDSLTVEKVARHH